MEKSIHSTEKCPCGSQQTYTVCCQPLHLAVQIKQPVSDRVDTSIIAQTPEQLMRSRYSAFVMKNFNYILCTHHQAYLNGLNLAQLSAGPHPQWLGLDVIEASPVSTRDTQGFVTFKAWYVLDGELDAIYERSEFLRENGQWYYTRGQQMTAKMPGRNDACICHSGKKFKQCCAKR